MLGLYSFEYKTKGYVKSKFAIYQSSKSTKEYVNYLKGVKKNPKEYIFDLFKENDIVVLTERMHPEGTQWDFINDIINDERFVNNIGLLYTEYGHIGLQDSLNSLIHNSNLSTEEIEQKTLYIVRNDAVWPYSDLFRFYELLKNIAKLNKGLPRDKEIDYQFTDANINWYNMTKKKYKEYEDSFLTNRDEIMATNIISDLKNRKTNKQVKCLVIMNFYHGMNTLNRTTNKVAKSTYDYLKKEYKGRITNVQINCRIYGGYPPIASGLWEKAFRDKEEKNKKRTWINKK